MRNERSSACRVAEVLVCAIVTMAMAWPARGDTRDGGRLQAELAAGEFAPALDAVRQITDPVRRDESLGRVFQAQQQVGAVNAASQTLWAIGNESRPTGASGGGSQADFDTLMQLITGTIAPTTWSDVGGAGAVRPFPGGVLADAEGVLRRVSTEGVQADLAAARRTALTAGENRDVRQSSELRKVSLPRLEKAIRVLLARGEPIDDELLTLAGLQRVSYLFVYPESGDIVLAGPAGDWRLDAEQRLVGQESGRPVLRLEDLVTLIRAAAAGELKFGCSITPTEEGLAKTKRFVETSNKKPLRPGERDAWLASLRQQLGRQEIEVFGISAHSRIAQVIVEADYRMKLVGLGLEEGTVGVTSYLDSIQVRPGAAPPPMDVLRWWFTMNYSAVVSDADRHVFQLRGPGVKVLSENELLAENGQRVHTGASDDRNRAFAESFTRNFAALATRYPVYAELQNIFDLALVVSVMKGADLPASIGWRQATFGDSERFPLSAGPAPRQVDTVLNHRVVNQTQIIAAVSGGVSVDPTALAKPEAVVIDRSPRLRRDYEYATPRSEHDRRWWWD